MCYILVREEMEYDLPGETEKFTVRPGDTGPEINRFAGDWVTLHILSSLRVLASQQESTHAFLKNGGIKWASKVRHLKPECLADAARVGSKGDDIKAIAQSKSTPQLVREALNMMHIVTAHVPGHRRASTPLPPRGERIHSPLRPPAGILYAEPRRCEAMPSPCGPERADLLGQNAGHRGSAIQVSRHAAAPGEGSCGPDTGVPFGYASLFPARAGREARLHRKSPRNQARPRRRPDKGYKAAIARRRIAHPAIRVYQ